MRIFPFDRLCLGARFKIESEKHIYVKIGVSRYIKLDPNIVDGKPIPERIPPEEFYVYCLDKFTTEEEKEEKVKIKKTKSKKKEKEEFNSLEGWAEIIKNR